MSYFETVIGQESIKRHLSELVQKEVLPHSLLFFGEAGLGKVDMAIGLASLLIGRQVFSPHQGTDYLEHIKEMRIQNKESAKKVDTEGLPLYIDGNEAFWLRPMKSTLKVEQWYLLLQDYLNVTSESPRVVIVEGFHTANTIMANAMLKTIEEPPANVFFIIVTDKRNTVLPTIVSRCMSVPFTAVADDVIRQGLQTEGIEGNYEAALAAGHGNPSLVRKLLEQESIVLLDLAFKVLDALVYEKRYFTMVSLWTEVLNREELQELFYWMRLLCRDMMALRYGAPQYVLQCPTYKEKLVKMLNKWPSVILAQVVKETLDADRALRLYVKASLVMDGLLISIHKALEEDKE